MAGFIHLHLELARKLSLQSLNGRHNAKDSTQADIFSFVVLSFGFKLLVSYLEAELVSSEDLVTLSEKYLFYYERLLVSNMFLDMFEET